MTVGLPGTGIGGLYYLTLALAMPVRELARALRGRSSAARWRTVAVQLGIAGGILALLWGQAWLLAFAARSLARAQPSGSLATAVQQVAPDGVWVFSSTGVAGLVVLAVILLSVHAARLLVRRAPPSEPRSVSERLGGAAPIPTDQRPTVAATPRRRKPSPFHVQPSALTPTAIRPYYYRP